MTVAVREATTADARGIRDVHLESIEGLGGRRYTDEQVSAWAHDRDPKQYPIESVSTYFLVAENTDRIVGLGWMTLEADDYLQAPVEAEITAVYVHPSVARHGIGSRIYNELEAHARRQDIASLGLWASLTAIPFYEAHGYDHVAEHTIEFDNHVEGTVMEMRKPLHQ
jgi:putative acetyltransferase